MTDFDSESTKNERECECKCKYDQVNINGVLTLVTPYKKFQLFDDYYCSNDLEKMDALMEQREIYYSTIDKFLIKSAQDKKLDTLKLLLKHGAHIHTDDDAALRTAVSNGELEMSAYLLEGGANVRACEDAALLSASFGQNLDLVEKLLEYGADIHCRDDEILKNLNYKFYAEFINKIVSCCDLYQYNLLNGPRGVFMRGTNIKNRIEIFLTNLDACDNNINCFALRHCFHELINELSVSELDGGLRLDHYLFNDETLSGIKRMMGHKLANKILTHGANIIDASIFPWYFNEGLANIVLGYCTADDYGYFPDFYIKKKVVFLKKAESVVSNIQLND